MQSTVPDLTYGYLASPVGPLLVAGDGVHVRVISFPSEDPSRQPQPGWRRDDAMFGEVFQQLSAYFAGDRTCFDLPLHFSGTTFQNTVWQALCDIPFGETISYGELATRIDQPNASRAVGSANGANPLPIVVPCHRVIGADGSLTGFGGGIEIKRFLLIHEQRLSPNRTAQGDLPI